MSEPKDTINTSGGTDEVVPDTQETAPDTEVVNNSPETDVDGGETQADTLEDANEESFLSPETRKSLEDGIKQNPDLKPNYDNWYKLMQSDYTKKRQEESATVKELKAKATLVDTINGDPALVKLIQDYKAGGLRQNTPKAEAVADVMEEVTRDFAPEEKMLFNRLKPAMEKLVGQMIDPLQKTASMTEEKSALAELSSNETYAHIPVDEYWADVKAIKTKYPAMTYEEALAFAIGKDFKVIGPQLKKFGVEESSEKAKPITKAKGKAGFVSGGAGVGAETVVEDSADLSPEEFRKKAGLKYAEQ